MSLSISVVSKLKKIPTFKITGGDDGLVLPCFDFVTGEATTLPDGTYSVLGNPEGFTSRVMISSDTGEIYEISRRIFDTLDLT